MGMDDKMKAAADKVMGKAKEVIGDVTDNADLKAEGKADQTKGDLRDAGENVKDAGKKAKDALTD